MTLMAVKLELFFTLYPLLKLSTFHFKVNIRGGEYHNRVDLVLLISES